MFDLKIIGGQVIDGTGRPAFRADVGIQGDGVREIGDLSAAEAKRSSMQPANTSAPALSMSTPTPTPTC